MKHKVEFSVGIIFFLLLIIGIIQNAQKLPLPMYGKLFVVFVFITILATMAIVIIKTLSSD